jgi:hypothetical protein
LSVPVAVVGSVVLALFGLGIWAITRSLQNLKYVTACSLKRQKRTLPSALIGSGLWMYGSGQWMRIVARVDATAMVPTIIGIIGFAVIAAVLEGRYRASLLSAVIGIPAGIGIGIFADAIYPIAGGPESNIWPIGIVLWVVLATPAVVIGLGAAMLGRRLLSKG